MHPRNMAGMLAALLLWFCMPGSAFATVSPQPPMSTEDELSGNGGEAGGSLTPQAGVRSVSFSPDGKIVASGLWNGTIRLLDAATGAEIRRLKWHSAFLNSVSFSPDGKTLASGLKDGTVRLCDLATGVELKRPAGHSASVNTVSFSPDAKTIASGSDDKSVRLWDVASGREIRRFEGHSERISSVSFSPDGKILASSSDDKTFRLWDVASGKEIRRFEGHSAPVGSVSFSPDGKTLASGSDDKTARLWDAATGREIRRFEGHSERINSVSFSPDGKKLASGSGNAFGSGDKTLRLWDVASGAEIKRLDGHLDVVNSVCFSPDGRTVASGSGDILGSGIKFVRLWDVASGGEIRRSEGPSGAAGNPAAPPADGRSKDIPIPARTHRPSMEITEAELKSQDRPLLRVFVKNTGEQDLSGDTEFRAVISSRSGIYQPLDVAIKSRIGAGEIAELTFAIPQEVRIDQSSRLILTARELKLPAHELSFDPQPITLPTPAWLKYLLLALIASACLAGGYYLRLFMHPLVSLLSKAPHELSRLPLGQMVLARRLLARAGRLDAILSHCSIPKAWLPRAIGFLKDHDAARRCSLLADRLGASCQLVSDSPIPVFKLRMRRCCTPNMDECLMAFPPADMPARSALAVLQRRDDIQIHACVIVSTIPEHQLEFRKKSENEDNLLVTPDSRDLTELLLSHSPEEALARLFASQIKASRISPYRITRGVVKEGAFFGRTQLLEHILQRQPVSFVLAGGRQMGKSSLLKAVQRRFELHHDVDCHYLALHNEDILTPLARLLGRPSGEPLGALLDSLKEKGEGRKRRLLLVDDADRLIEAEAGRGFSTMRQLRSLSDEGHCHFIFAGFWSPYRECSLVDQSPLKGLGETLVLGGLEPEAARALATKPMDRLGIRYEPESLVDTLLSQTGLRPNLIAITCNEILGRLDMRDKVIRPEKLEEALAGKAIRHSLGGWGSLTENEHANRLDRIFVYATIRREPFTLTDLLHTLETLGCPCEPQKVSESLERLQLAFILAREGSHFSFRVPVLKEMILAQEPELCLKSELLEIPGSRQPQITLDIQAQ